MNLTILFNPAFDSGAYVADPADGTVSFGEKHVGALGLLQELELRLGLTAPDKGAHELLSAYHNAALAAAKEDPGVFFAESLSLSPLKTASELLAWRDELVLSGWTASSPVPDTLTDGARSILSGLAAVEGKLGGDFRTLSDRWTAVAKTIKEATIPEGLRLVLLIPEKRLHPLYRDILGILRSKGIPVEERPAAGSPEVTVKRFRDSVDACWWAACTAEDELIVCDDSLTLGAAMAALGRQDVNAFSPASLRPIEHLFLSGMMLLADAHDIEALRDYLSCPYHPLNAYKSSDGKSTLRRDLLFHLLSQGGFGEDGRTGCSFDDIVATYAGGNAKTLEEIRRFLPERGKPVSFGRIKALCRALSEWAASCMRAVSGKETAPALTGQWAALIGYCQSMEFICRVTGMERLGEIGCDDLLGALRSVYVPDALTDTVARVGSAALAPRIEGIASETRSVIWVAPVKENAREPLPFLCEADVLSLSGTLGYVWTREDALLHADDAFSAGLARIKERLTVLYCDTIHGQKKEKHPFLLRGGLKLEGLPYEGIPATHAAPVALRPANTVQDSYPVDGSLVSSPASESPSSLEGMFACPFDWVVQRVLGLYEEHDSNLSTIEGTVAHSVIHRICLLASEGGKEVTPAAFGKVFASEYDRIFDEAVDGYGAELNLPENRIECSQFRTILRERGIPVLQEILTHSGLVIAGSEVPFRDVDLSEPGYEPLTLSGTIDLLARNAAGQYVVIDFKWAGSQGRKDRSEQVKRGEDYQLALYRRVLEKDRGYTVAAQAFYMLRTAELLTAYPVFSDAEGPIAPIAPGARTPQKSYPETVADIQGRYSEAVRALRGGSVARKKLQYESNQILKGNLN